MQLFVSFTLFAIALVGIIMNKVKQPVIVVGSGLAGLTSTYKLLEQKVPVILIEKQDKFGGNSIKASSGINGAISETQKRQSFGDSIDSFFNDTVKSSGEIGDRKLQSLLVKDSQRAIEWLQKDVGLPLDIVNRLGGHSFPRTHRSTGIPPGFEIVSKLQKKVMADEGLRVLLNSKLVDIDVNGGKVNSVTYVDSAGEKHEIETSNVIMATGGFGFSKKLLKKYRPDLVSYPTTNGDHTLGEGQVLLESLGAELIDMDQVQVHPTGFIKQDDRENNWKFLAAESLRGIGGVLLNKDLKRFVNELNTRDVVSAAVTEQPGNSAYLILNEDMYQDFKMQIDFYTKMQLFEKTTIKEKFNGNESLVALLEDYSTSTEDEFGRGHKAHTFKGITLDTPLFIGEITPVVHFTMGGVRINENAQVEGKDGAIEGLYAAGEVSGGVHGKNRLGGNSLLECVVFGSRAAEDIISRW